MPNEQPLTPWQQCKAIAEALSPKPPTLEEMQAAFGMSPRKDSGTHTEQPLQIR
jgi:hypothetical protein